MKFRIKSRSATTVNIRPSTVDAVETGVEDDVTVTVDLEGADADGTVAVFVISSLPENGTLKTTDGVTLAIGATVPATDNAAQVEFHPTRDWNGTTSFQYVARDNQGFDDLTPATATITLSAVNDPPTTADLTATGDQDTEITVTLSGVDPDGTVASFTISTLPANGTLKTVGGVTLIAGDTVAATGDTAQVVFHPTAAWFGTTSFTYAAKDNTNVSDATPATATIIVDEVVEFPVGDEATVIRSTEKQEYDLATLLSDFDDVGNDITVSLTNPTGNFQARIWNMRDLVGGDDFAFKKRELLDYFQVHAIGADEDDEMVVSFSGYTGPNGTGDLETRSLTVTCDNSAPTATTWSTVLRAQFGGWPIHKYLPGNQADWTLSNDNGGQFEILRDNTSRSCLGSGRSYANGVSRVVLKPKTSNPNGMDLNSGNSTYGNQLASAPYGGLPNVAPVDATTSSFTLSNAVLGQTHTVMVTWSATAPIDVGAWPLVDSLTISGRAPWQLNWYSRLGNTLYYRYGTTFRLLDDLDHVYSASGSFAPGFTFSGGSTTIGGTAPTTLFTNGAFGGRQHPLDGSLPIYNPQLITITGESPDTYLYSLSILSTSTNAASTTMGWHVKKLQARNLVFSYSRNIACASNILVHDPADIDAGLTLQVRPSTAGGTISCWIKGALGFSGSDAQVFGNTFEAPHTVLDHCVFGTQLAQSNPDELVALLAFNTWVGCRGQDVVTHKDGFQWTGGTSPPGGPFLGTEEDPDRSNAGYHTAHVVIGNVWYNGGRRGQRIATSGAFVGKKMPAWAEVFFSIPLNPNGLLRWVFAYNMAVASVGNGFWLHNPRGKTRIHHNMLLKWRDTNLAFSNNPGFTIRTYDEHQYQNGGTLWAPGSFEDGVDDADYMFLYNICQGGYSSDLATNAGTPGTNAGAGGGTYDNDTQDATLVNPLILDDVQDLGDIIPAYSLQEGLTPSNVTEANPFHHLDVIDHRRRFADLDAIANYEA